MIEETEEEKKKGDGSNDDKPSVPEVILAEQQRDPEEAAVAELAIRRFVRERLSDFYEQVEASLNSLENWVASQPADAQEVLAERGFFDSVGDRFLVELYGIAGGKGAPVMDTLVCEVDGAVSFAQASSFHPSIFIEGLRRGVRDACWFVRDACMSILSHQWAELLDMATAGSIDFVPALYALGLPSSAFQSADFAASLIGHAEAYRNARELRREAVKDPTIDKRAEDEAHARAIQEELLQSRKDAQSSVL